MSLYYQNMFRSGHGSHVLVSHLPLGSFPSARNKAQIWWVPAMAIHSTLSSSPPTHENKTHKKPHRINMGAGTGVSALGHLPVSLSIIQQLLWYLSFVVELCSWAVFGTTVCSSTRTKCVFSKVKVRNRFFFFRQQNYFCKLPLSRSADCSASELSQNMEPCRFKTHSSLSDKGHMHSADTILPLWWTHKPYRHARSLLYF